MDIFIDGGIGFVPPFSLSVADGLGVEILSGEAVAFGSDGDRLEFLFDTVVDATGLFGPQVLVLATLSSTVADPFGPSSDFDGFAGLSISTPAAIPVPATVSLLVAGLAALGIARRLACR